MRREGREFVRWLARDRYAHEDAVDGRAPRDGGGRSNRDRSIAQPGRLKQDAPPTHTHSTPAAHTDRVRPQQRLFSLCGETSPHTGKHQGGSLLPTTRGIFCCARRSGRSWCALSSATVEPREPRAEEQSSRYGAGAAALMAAAFDSFRVLTSRSKQLISLWSDIDVCSRGRNNL